MESSAIGKFSLGAATLWLALGAAHADEAVEQVGKARFAERCAVCHGANAKGDGPFAALLAKKPPDLTTLAARHQGSFPFDKVYDTVDGRSMPLAHGSRDMPIWGRDIKGKGLGAETEVRGQLLETVIYLRSIQAK